ncbi:MAG: MmgE/PrpD family protein [Pseudonocardia sp.]|nr:MmgE/PrpD family protein [Pseudonocardia sp.]
MTDTAIRTETAPLSRPVGNPLERLAAFSADLPASSVPDDVFTAAERGVVDLLGVAVAGAVQPDMAALNRYVSQTYREGKATALGLPSRMAPEAAAYLNGAAGHVLDFDDCNDALGGHPTVPVLPSVLALAEETGASARDVLTAYVVGVEVEGAIGRCLNLTHYERGWHPTATLGIFGAASASARILGADAEQVERALAIAASMASGIKGNFGTFMKPGQVGFAAAKGVAAARLALAGATANTDVFRGQHSFPGVFNGTPDIDWSPLEQLGTLWNILSPGLVFKLYPCCGSTHAAIDAVLELHRDGAIDAESIKTIDIYLHPRRQPHTNRPDPRTGLAGKFSVQYVTAAAALRGAVTVADFAEEQVNADVIRKILPHVQVHDLAPDEQIIVPGRLDCFAAAVEVVDRGGKHRRLVPAPKGSDPSVPVSDRDLDQKFVATAGIAVGSSPAEEALRRLHMWAGGNGSLRDVMGYVHEHMPR